MPWWQWQVMSLPQAQLTLHLKCPACFKLIVLMQEILTILLLPHPQKWFVSWGKKFVLFVFATRPCQEVQPTRA